MVISTPDHQHAICAVAAVRAGKDVYLQKPASLTIAEGRYLSDVVQKSGRIFQIGSQQRSLSPWEAVSTAPANFVRNGQDRGQLKHVEIGLPGDPSGPAAPEMPVPKNLNYDAWLDPSDLYPVLHGDAGASTGGFQQARLVALRAIRRRHDHGLGRASCRHSALGDGYRTHGTGRGSGVRPSFRRAGFGTFTAHSKRRRFMRMA